MSETGQHMHYLKQALSRQTATGKLATSVPGLNKLKGGADSITQSCEQLWSICHSSSERSAATIASSWPKMQEQFELIAAALETNFTDQDGDLVGLQHYTIVPNAVNTNAPHFLSTMALPEQKLDDDELEVEARSKVEGIAERTAAYNDAVTKARNSFEESAKVLRDTIAPKSARPGRLRVAAQ